MFVFLTLPITLRRDHLPLIGKEFDSNFIDIYKNHPQNSPPTITSKLRRGIHLLEGLHPDNQ